MGVVNLLVIGLVSNLSGNERMGIMGLNLGLQHSTGIQIRLLVQQLLVAIILVIGFLKFWKIRI